MLKLRLLTTSPLDAGKGTRIQVCSAYVLTAGAFMSSPIVSRAALAAGVPVRYLYWIGRSSRRYLFTCTDWPSLSDFAEGVAIAVSAGEIVWSGEIAALTSLPPSAEARRATLYVHLLACNAEERRAVIEDLRPACGGHLRLAA